MKILRIGLGVLVLLWTLMNIVLVVGMPALYKLGQLGELSGEGERMIPLYETTAWWHLAVVVVVIVLWLVAAWRLFRGGRAFAPYTAGLLVNAVSFLIMRETTAYNEVFTPAELRADYYIFAALALVAALIWLTERKRA